jgi:hypothetical protein
MRIDDTPAAVLVAFAAVQPEWLCSQCNLSPVDASV